MIKEQMVFSVNEAIKKSLSHKLLAKKLSAVRFFILFFIFRKLAMRYAIIFIFLFF